ncbi:hypothetical protein [uncultured Devosia sp.]|uniref:hypothetical protein n=1 Tax=uncultured Devosia sp. TaxID=211434 RepID=UPI00263063AF|nr:hypothetical protein [uncultured Devosia sp.]
MSHFRRGLTHDQPADLLQICSKFDGARENPMTDKDDISPHLVALNATLVEARKKAESARAKQTGPSLASRGTPPVAASCEDRDFGDAQGGEEARQREVGE